MTFQIEVEAKVFYQPIMLAAVIGNAELLRELLKNPTVDVNAKCEQNGCNSFWLACYYGRGECMGLLASAGIDIMNVHNETRSNGLHVALERGHYALAKQLVFSKYPMSEVKKGGLTALIIIAKESKKEATDTGH